MAPKGKAKQQSVQDQDTDPDAIDSQLALQLIDELQANTLPLHKRLWLAKADALPCDCCCKHNDKVNPGCFCGWVPAPSSYKKKGLWQKEPGALASLGREDPKELRREVSNLPGAACRPSTRSMLRTPAIPISLLLPAGPCQALWPEQPGPDMLHEQRAAVPVHGAQLPTRSV